MRAGRASRNSCGSKPSRGSKCPRWIRALRMRSSRNERSPSRVRSHVWTYQYGSRRSSEYGSTRCGRALLLALLQVVDLDQAPFAQAAAERADEVLLGPLHVRLGRLRELELAEGLLELGAHAVERRARVGGDHRADELERQPDRARLERRQARRRAEGVAEQLLVHADRVAVELGVDGVAAAAEVDEVEQREVLLERLERDVETLDQLLRRELGLRVLAAAVEQVGEQRLQDGEALGMTGRGRPLDRVLLGLGPLSAASVSGAPSCRSRTSLSSRATSRRSSSGACGTARPSWRSTHEASSPRLE